MEKVLQIVAVFVLMMLIIQRFIRGREPAYRPFNYLTRMKPPLAVEVAQRLVQGGLEAGQTDAFIVDESRRLLFSYNVAGSLTIHWQKREMQWLAAPPNCTAMMLDPEEGRLYLEAEGFLFVYAT